MKHRVLFALLVVLFHTACARPQAPAFAGKGFRTVGQEAGYELPDGYVPRSASVVTHSTAERVASAALLRHGYVRDDVSPELEVVVVPALRQSALQSKGGIEWSTASSEDHVVFIAVRERATGRVFYETTVKDGAEGPDAVVLTGLPRHTDPISAR